MILQKLREYMMGRNGPDAFSLALAVSGFVLNIPYVITRAWPFYLVSIALYGWALFRVLSKNLPARQKENQKFLSFTWKLRNFWGDLKCLWEEQKIYKHFRCPQCKQKIRIPRGRGKVEVCCPKCSHRFVKKV